ncbi:hypothetical protein [Paenibacillus sp. Marseille-Q4541]|uniref:hypothetical protein n=1 Tax=Paenibacillus sp. Marseille-Q4541 TaxID=2831522 RepID=UPI001BAD6395|nr:hypothetical protein [Paenibacillus sp. Marseille-Q4541]
MNVIDSIQLSVDEIAVAEYENDITPPKFTVSLLYEECSSKELFETDYEHKIIMTVEHNGLAFSKVLFPCTDMIYGYSDLKDIMKYLYNRTM